MTKPKRKVVFVGVTTHTMCFSCYCHKQIGSIKPYRLLGQRRKAVRYRRHNDSLHKFRFAIVATTKKHRGGEIVDELLELSLISVSLPLGKRAIVQAQDR